jgi:hypothetical protein
LLNSTENNVSWPTDVAHGCLNNSDITHSLQEIFLDNKVLDKINGFSLCVLQYNL